MLKTIGARDLLPMRLLQKAVAASVVGSLIFSTNVYAAKQFDVMEATIDGIQKAILAKRLTTTELVHMYLDRIAVYNGPCVQEPQGILGPIIVVPHAKQIPSLETLNLRPATRIALGFDAHHGRSQTDMVDNDPAMPDALEVAAMEDAYFAQTGKLIGPLHGVVMSIKDAYDTFDMRTTSGADAYGYVNDRPPTDATNVARLRAAGAIILAKSAIGEYQGGNRSSFGGTVCDVYDTTRNSGGSSAGNGPAISSNLVTCGIGEETGGSILSPSRSNGLVGIPPTRELMSASGMIQQGLSTRVGPMCRTVEDAARVLDVIAGYDPKDDLTAFSVGRRPPKPYYTYAKAKRLDGMRIGVLREFGMDKAMVSSAAHYEAIDLINQAVDDLAALGATMVDPGAGGALFQSCVDQMQPEWRNSLFVSQFPDLFPPGTDQMPQLVDMFLNPSHVPHTATGSPSMRNIGPAAGDTGGATFNFDWYLKRRGDPGMQTVLDLATKSNFYDDPANGFPTKQTGLLANAATLTYSTTVSHQQRFAVQTMMFKCFADKNLDAIVYPSNTLPPAIMGSTAGREPTANDWSGSSTFPSNMGFPAITVPAGMTTVSYDRNPDGTLRPPIPAVLPIGVEFLALPFNEPTLFSIAGAYESATHHRMVPPDFGPL